MSAWSMDQELWFIAFLGSSPTATFENGTLTLTNGTDTIAMTKAPGGLGASQVGVRPTLEGSRMEIVGGDRCPASSDRSAPPQRVGAIQWQ